MLRGPPPAARAGARGGRLPYVIDIICSIAPSLQDNICILLSPDPRNILFRYVHLPTQKQWCRGHPAPETESCDPHWVYPRALSLSCLRVASIYAAVHFRTYMTCTHGQTCPHLHGPSHDSPSFPFCAARVHVARVLGSRSSRAPLSISPSKQDSSRVGPPNSLILASWTGGVRGVGTAARGTRHAHEKSPNPPIRTPALPRPFGATLALRAASGPPLEGLPDDGALLFRLMETSLGRCIPVADLWECFLAHARPGPALPPPHRDASRGPRPAPPPCTCECKDINVLYKT